MWIMCTRAFIHFMPYFLVKKKQRKQNWKVTKWKTLVHIMGWIQSSNGSKKKENRCWMIKCVWLSVSWSKEGTLPHLKPIWINKIERYSLSQKIQCDNHCVDGMVTILSRRDMLWLDVCDLFWIFLSGSKIYLHHFMISKNHAGFFKKGTVKESVFWVSIKDGYLQRWRNIAPTDKNAIQTHIQRVEMCYVWQGHRHGYKNPCLATPYKHEPSPPNFFFRNIIKCFNE